MVPIIVPVTTKQENGLSKHRLKAHSDTSCHKTLLKTNVVDENKSAKVT